MSGRFDHLEIRCADPSTDTRVVLVIEGPQEPRVDLPQRVDNCLREAADLSRGCIFRRGCPISCRVRIFADFPRDEVLRLVNVWEREARSEWSEGGTLLFTDEASLLPPGQ